MGHRFSATAKRFSAIWPIVPFQQKIGSGLTKEQFAQKVKDGSVRHVGLAESVTMIADALGWKLDKVTDEIHPKIAERAVASDLIAVDPGYVCGLIQDGIGWVKGQPASITVNSIPKILRVTPGLRTMADMPIPSCFGGR